MEQDNPKNQVSDDEATGGTHPAISVVTVCWNCRDVIEGTMRSVLDQSYDPVEYIVIDGGSTDGTVDVIRTYESELATWVSEPDDGISDAFNKGIRRANGDLIGLINAGDAYEPGALASIADAAQHDPKSDVFYGDIYMTSDDGTPEYVRKARRGLKASAFRYSMPAIPHPSVFARRDLYEERLYDPDLSYAMDYEWLRDMAERGHRFYCVEGEVLARMRLEGTSNDQYADTLAEVHRICVRYGDPPGISFLYNRVFRTIRFQLRRAIETTAVGREFVEGYRQLIAQLGLRRWEY
jgi:glycosyltransferase involved in cell wall biosynthesis